MTEKSTWYILVYCTEGTTQQILNEITKASKTDPIVERVLKCPPVTEQ